MEQEQEQEQEQPTSERNLVSDMLTREVVVTSTVWEKSMVMLIASLIFWDLMNLTSLKVVVQGGGQEEVRVPSIRFR